MQLRILRNCVFFAIFLIGGSAYAQQSADDKSNSLVDLLDPSVPQARREATFEHYKKMAVDGNASAQYIVGSLYRVGERAPGNLVARDWENAKRYLSTAAAHGHVRAMAKMAEIELADKHYLEANVWAQLYAHYSGAVDAAAKDEKEGPANGYVADLLRRVFEHFDDKQNAVMQQDVNAFIVTHDADIRAGKAGAQGILGASKMQMKPESQRHHHYNPSQMTQNRDKRDVLADYLVAFDAQGDAANAWLIDALPDIDLGRELKVVALSLEVNDAPGADLRYGIVPINFSWGRYKLRAK